MLKTKRITIDVESFDAVAARALLSRVEVAFAEGARAVVLDLTQVKQIDSLGVSALATLAKRAPSGVRVVLAGLSPYVKTVARVTHLHELFAIYATPEAALSALSA